MTRTTSISVAFVACSLSESLCAFSSPKTPCQMASYSQLLTLAHPSLRALQSSAVPQSVLRSTQQQLN